MNYACIYVIEFFTSCTGFATVQMFIIKQDLILLIIKLLPVIGPGVVYGDAAQEPGTLIWLFSEEKYYMERTNLLNIIICTYL